MSKCDISIVFDHDDRTYTGGDQVTGRVVIQVNNDVTCRKIAMTHQWKTHGKGNVDSGPKETIELAPGGPLVAGETLNLPFAFTSPTHPVTYHGHLLNVDHYLSVEVDIPWSINPKAQEEYILVAGEAPPQFVGSRNAVISLAAPPQKMGPVGMILLGALLLALLIPLAMLAVCLVPFALIALAILWFVRRAIANRLGEVQLEIPRVVVAPGEDWTVRLQFQPKKQCPINGIFVTLTGKESAKSGSGTQATTHTHPVFEQKAMIRPAQTLQADVPVDENFSITFPTTTAYSFSATDNSINWNAEVRIDIPSFPDWTKSQSLQVVPIEFLQRMSEGTPAAVDADTYSSVDSPSIAAALNAAPLIAPRPSASVSAYSEDTDHAEEIASSNAPPQDLMELAAQIAAASRHGNDRAHIVGSVIGEVFDASIIVERVNSSIGGMSCPSGFEDGKTLVGTIQGTDQSIQILTPKSLNDDINALRRGHIWHTHVTVDSWDNLYNRINARRFDDAAG